MTALFVGGPLDGLTFNHEQINQVADIVPPRQSESGFRNFILMPTPAGCTRILKEEIKKDDCRDTRQPYEQLRMADGTIEYHDAGAAFGHALWQAEQPLTEEQQELKAKFAAIADRFIERLNESAVTADTEVSFVMLYRDRQGLIFRSEPVVISGKPTLTGFDPEMAKRWADSINLETAIGNINSLVRTAPTDFVDFPGHPSNVLQVYDFELLIRTA
jgi:hypothetical protein